MTQVSCKQRPVTSDKNEVVFGEGGRSKGVESAPRSRGAVFLGVETRPYRELSRSAEVRCRYSERHDNVASKILINTPRRHYALC